MMIIRNFYIFLQLLRCGDGKEEGIIYLTGNSPTYQNQKLQKSEDFFPKVIQERGKEIRNYLSAFLGLCYERRNNLHEVIPPFRYDLVIMDNGSPSDY